MEELARGEASTLGVKLPKLLIQGKTYLARYKEVANMIQNSNNYHTKHLRESPVKAFVDWKIERKTRLANETLKEIPLTPIPTTTEPQEPAPARSDTPVSTPPPSPVPPLRAGRHDIDLNTSHPHVIDGDRLTHRPQTATILEFSMRHAVDWTRTAPPL